VTSRTSLVALRSASVYERCGCCILLAEERKNL
jgi:hypothetical protein